MAAGTVHAREPEATRSASSASPGASLQPIG